MQRKEFKKLLEEAGLKKSDFCNIIGLNYSSVNNWGSSDIKIPIWVKSWLENYIKAKNYEKMKNKVYEIEKIF